ncbi:hypothetical protein ABTZ58_07075 [Streptomyces sp. NPDC094143]|uniref:hypothetical protein n=1 Tax=Streptomyces sp. NPDC094143 TaxID=3155310 RepID=UPI003324FFE2
MSRQLDQLPADATTLAKKVAALEREMRELRASRRMDSATAALIQTAAAGPRVALDGSGPALLIYGPDESVLGRFGPDPIDGGAGLWTKGQQPIPLLAYLYGGEMRWRPADENQVVEAATAVYDTDLDTYTDLILSPGRVLPGDIPAQLIMTTSVGGGPPLMDVRAVLTAKNWAIGSTTITPAAANTPTSASITGLNLLGSTFFGFATAATAVPGSTVTGVGITAVTATGATLWATRTNTTATTVNWMVIGL